LSYRTGNRAGRRSQGAPTAVFWFNPGTPPCSSYGSGFPCSSGHGARTAAGWWRGRHPSLPHTAGSGKGGEDQRQKRICHNARMPAGPSPSPGRTTAGRSERGNVGRTWWSCLLRIGRFCGTGFCNRFRSHCGRYWAIIILVSRIVGLRIGGGGLADGHRGNAPTSAAPILFSRQVQPAYICLPSAKRSGWRGLHPQPSRRQRVAPLIELRIRNGGRCW